MSLPESTRVPDGLEDVADALAGRMDATVGELVDLARIPSISAPGHDRAPVRRSAERTARLLEDAGLEHVELLEIAACDAPVCQRDSQVTRH